MKNNLLILLASVLGSVALFLIGLAAAWPVWVLIIIGIFVVAEVAALVVLARYGKDTPQS